MEDMRRYFEVSADSYVSGSDLKVYRPASLNNPKDESVMFVTEGFMSYSNALLKCKNCLVFWPENIDVPKDISSRHAICLVKNPHKEYCRFYRDNNISNLPKAEAFEVKQGAYIAKGAKIGTDCTIFPGVYIGSDVTIGNHRMPVYMITVSRSTGSRCRDFRRCIS